MFPRRGAGAALLIGLFSLGLTGCPATDSLTGSKPLTPARKLEGTWKTAFPVTITYQSDFCGGYQNVATSQWNVTWIVTAREGFENVLDIEMRYTRTSSTPLASNCGGGGNGWVPLVSPTFLEATVSSSQVTAYDKSSGISAFGSYITSSMTLTWVHKECIIYCTGEVSKTNEFKMVKQ